MSNQDAGSVTVIDGATNATSYIAINGPPWSLAANEATNTIYAATPGTSISVIHGATNAATAGGGARWNFESLDFSTTVTSFGGCPAGTVPVHRAYNDGFRRGVDSNHRISSNYAAIQQVLARGWIYEGVVMCAPG